MRYRKRGAPVHDCRKEAEIQQIAKLFENKLLRIPNIHQINDNCFSMEDFLDPEKVLIKSRYIPVDFLFELERFRLYMYSEGYFIRDINVIVSPRYITIFDFSKCGEIDGELVRFPDNSDYNIICKDANVDCCYNYFEKIDALSVISNRCVSPPI